ncbi:MAG: S8 family serine peptidase [Armatimonadetes bacterium]|nr:S8 family serine peptidase [Armatimonadota bacterium]
MQRFNPIRTGGTRGGPLRSLTRMAGLAALALGSISANAQVFDKTTLLKISKVENLNNLASMKKANAWAAKTGFPTKKVLPNGRILVLDGWENGAPLFKITNGAADAFSVGADQLWPGGSLGLSLTGSSVRLGIWEAGGNPYDVHREFKGRVFIKDGDYTYSDHATHVAGIMIATGLLPSAKGMSYEGSLSAYNANNDDSECAFEAAGGLNLSNHSYGFYGGWIFGAIDGTHWVWMGDTALSATEDSRFGRYDGLTRVWDDITYNSPYYLPCVSAGNERNPGVPSGAFEHYVWNATSGQWELVTAARDDQSTYDTICFGPQIAKNTLTVAAVSALSGPYTGPSSVRMASFSSWGPADDGRIKPEISGVGVDVISSVNYDQYAAFSGTSMSGPNVCGTLGLLEQHYRTLHGTPMRASMMKGLVMHTARECGPFDGPDYAYGFGLLNAVDAVNVVTQSAFDATVLQDVELMNGQTVTLPVTVDSGTPFKVTICWTDPAGTATNAFDSRTPVLVNDVDLRLVNVLTGQTYYPWILDVNNPSDAATRGDNVVDPEEQVYIAAPEAGLYNIVISHKGSLRSGSQMVSVVTTATRPGGVRELGLDPGQVVGGVQNTVATLRLAEPTTEAATFNVITSNPRVTTVPSSVVVPAGEDSVSFTVQTRTARPRLGDDRVRASITVAGSKGSKSASLDLLPIGVSAISLTSDEVSGGQVVDGVVTLSNPAPRNGATVRIYTSNLNVARPLRNWIYIPEGRTQGTFKVRTSAVTDTKFLSVTANRLGSEMSTDLLVTPPSLASVSATPTAVKGGATVRVTVSLDGLSSGQAVVKLTSSNPSVFPVPSTVTIKKGQRTIRFTVATTEVTDAKSVTITAERLGVTKSTAVAVNP